MYSIQQIYCPDCDKTVLHEVMPSGRIRCCVCGLRSL